ncbi:DUF2892 domain-containing protein [Halopseudomonas nanhaiensis]|nr:DUF2892 domain-containing protein [Halopseudomonas nanhaiensis]
MLNQISNKNGPENVQGWERAASAVTGLMMVKKGLRARGLGSLVLLATGGMAIMRAVNGRCELKRMLTESQHGGSQGADKERYSHMPMDSEVHSPDFKSSGTSMPDSTQMGNEASAARGATPSGSATGSNASGTTGSSAASGSSSGSGTSGGVGSSGTLGNPTPAGTSGSTSKPGSSSSGSSSSGSTSGSPSSSTTSGSAGSSSATAGSNPSSKPDSTGNS